MDCVTNVELGNAGTDHAYSLGYLATNIPLSEREVLTWKGKWWQVIQGDRQEPYIQKHRSVVYRPSQKGWEVVASTWI